MLLCYQLCNYSTQLHNSLIHFMQSILFRKNWIFNSNNASLCNWHHHVCLVKKNRKILKLKIKIEMCSLNCAALLEYKL